MEDKPKTEPQTRSLLDQEFCKEVERARLEFKRHDGYFQRACDDAFREQIRTQDKTGGF